MAPAVTPSPPTTFNFADVWEFIADAVPDREALVCGPRRLTFAELEARANRFANHLLAAGVEPGERVAIFCGNATEYLEALLGSWKVRAVPMNVNHRYSSAELGGILADAEPTVLVYEATLAPVVLGLDAARVAGLRTAVAVGDPVTATPAPDPGGVPGAITYDDAVAAQPDTRPAVAGRSGDDHYLLYTGGTTGSPKGVLWRQEDAFFPCFGGGDPTRSNPVTTPEEIAGRVSDFAFCYFCIAPLMHAAGQWVALSWLWVGGKVVLHVGSLDPERIWDQVDTEGVNLLTVIGDAVGKPLLESWLANPGRWKAEGLFALSNGGAPMSTGLKERLADAFPGRSITDGFGSSETGAQGSHVLAVDAAQRERDHGVARFRPYGDDTAVLDENLARVRPGSGEVGRVALRGRIPLGYLNDPERTAATFVEHGGDRWVLTGDLAQVAEDGTVTLLGRGSQCINTGGEKVFSEEVELRLHEHPAVRDVVVVGVPDERWGQAVCAVVAPAAGVTPTLEELREHCRQTLAGYKLPKHLVLVDEVHRSPAGKADYRWAREVADGVAGVG